MLVSVDNRAQIQPRMRRPVPHRYPREAMVWIPPRFFTRHSSIMTHKRLTLYSSSPSHRSRMSLRMFPMTSSSPPSCGGSSRGWARRERVDLYWSSSPQKGKVKEREGVCRALDGGLGHGVVYRESALDRRA